MIWKLIGNLQNGANSFCLVETHIMTAEATTWIIGHSFLCNFISYVVNIRIIICIK